MANIFDGTFSGYHGETISATVHGFTITARLEHDTDAGEPWKNCDAYGPVSEWTTRDKKPGERVLCSDGRGRSRNGSRRYYDWAEAIQIARRDGWDAPPCGEGTAGQRAARAVEADFQRLARWCNDEWYYVAVVLSVSRNGITLDDNAAALCGIESDAGDYLTEVANELADEALDVGRAKLKELCTLTDDDFEEVDEDEPADKPQVLLPDWLVTQYEQRAQAEREDGGGISINYEIPIIAVVMSNGATWSFQEHEAQALLDEVPDNLTPEDFILASAQGW